MRIAFIIGSLTGGGAERVVSELANSFVENNNSVSVILISEYKISYIIDSKVDVVDATCPYSKRGFGRINRILFIHNYLKQSNFDVVLSFTTKVNNIALLAHVGLTNKLILCERNDPRFDPQEKGERLLRKVLYGMADGYVFQTQGEKEYFSSNIQKKSMVIQNPINPLLPNVFEGKRAKKIVTATRLTKQKNLKMAIEGFSQFSKLFPEFSFEIYGKGELENELTSYITELNLSDKIFLKGQSYDLYNDILDASYFVLTSNYEGISNSMLEAIALGIPTICTDYPSGGARETITNNENGILIPVNDCHALTKALIKLERDTELREKISKNGIKIRQIYSLDKIKTKWIEFIEFVTK